MDKSLEWKDQRHKWILTERLTHSKLPTNVWTSFNIHLRFNSLLPFYVLDWVLASHGLLSDPCNFLINSITKLVIGIPNTETKYQLIRRGKKQLEIKWDEYLYEFLHFFRHILIILRFNNRFLFGRKANEKDFYLSYNKVSSYGSCVWASLWL